MKLFDTNGLTIGMHVEVVEGSTDYWYDWSHETYYVVGLTYDYRGDQKVTAEIVAQADFEQDNGSVTDMPVEMFRGVRDSKEPPLVDVATWGKI